LRRLLLAEPAERDLDSIIDDIARDNPIAAERVYRAIAAAAQGLTNFPETGRSGRLSGTRELPVSSRPDVIVYEVGTDLVTIPAVFRSRRDLARALAERKSELEH
jgi:toxin ParE1/3/4